MYCFSISLFSFVTDSNTLYIYPSLTLQCMSFLIFKFLGVNFDIRVQYHFNIEIL